MVYCTYGFVLGVITFAAVIEEKHLFHSVYENIRTGEKIEASWWIVIRYLFDTYLELAFTIIIQFVCSVMLVVFTTYHSYLVYYNATTAESAKISEHLSYFTKKKSLLDWAKEDVKEVHSMFSDKELEPYSIEKAKLEDHDYVGNGLKK